VKEGVGFSQIMRIAELLAGVVQAACLPDRNGDRAVVDHDVRHQWRIGALAEDTSRVRFDLDGNPVEVLPRAIPRRCRASDWPTQNFGG
jgi:hypothetical protein